MSNSTSDKPNFVDATKIGEYAAQQPLSGVGYVMQGGAVNGLSNGGFLRMSTSETVKPTAA